MNRIWDRQEQRMLLLLDARQRILEEVYKKPGIHFRELERRTELATGQLEYHTDILIRAGLIKAEKDGRYVRYYPPMKNEDVKKVLQHLHREKVRQILAYILENGETRADELRSIAGISPSALTWHMKRLMGDGIVVKTGNKIAKYRLTNPEVVETALQIHRDGLLDRLADRLAELWEW